MATTIKIEAKSDKLVENIVRARTVCGVFDVGDGIKHPFQITLQNNDLIRSIPEQKGLLKQRIRDLIRDFKKTKPVSANVNNEWNEEYTENID